MAEWPEGVRRQTLDIVDSTNSEGRRIAGSISEPTWIMARHQTSGRGRIGRSWISSPGSFSATLAMPVDGAANVIALRSFVAALALRDAFVAVSGRERPITLKWPNDVLINEGKVAGILLEYINELNLQCLLIGFGVNLATAPTILGADPKSVRPVSLTGSTGVHISGSDFLTELAATYSRRDRQFVDHGFEPIRIAWLKHAARLGESITVRTAKSKLRGLFRTVDGEGRAIIESADKSHAIAAAEFIF